MFKACRLFNLSHQMGLSLNLMWDRLMDILGHLSVPYFTNHWIIPHSWLIVFHGYYLLGLCDKPVLPLVFYKCYAINLQGYPVRWLFPPLCRPGNWDLGRLEWLAQGHTADKWRGIFWIWVWLGPIFLPWENSALPSTNINKWKSDLFVKYLQGNWPTTDLGHLSIAQNTLNDG